MIHIYPATRGDAIDLAPRLRPEDALEAIGWGQTPQSALVRSVDEGLESCTALDETGRVIGMFGLGHHEPALRVTTVWLMGTDDILTQRKYLRPFWVHVCTHLHRWHQHHPLLGNVVHRANTVHIQWLERAGFIVNYAAPVTSPAGHIYYPFVRYENV